ncbi:MAG: tail fiber domain-containing protein [Proteobacteria bacterium]|nr:tail fiber domain-containing protein [Pseudomonadota bacterium]
MSLITNTGQKIQVSNILAQTLPSTTLFIDSPLQLKDTILFKDPQPMPGDVLTFTGGYWQPGSGGGGGGGITSLNGLVTSNQSFVTGTAGSDFAISSSGSTHTFDLPDAGSASRGVVNTTSQTFSGDKTFEGNVIIGDKISWNGGIEIGSSSSITGYQNAIAIGKQTTATGDSSIAIGWNVTAANQNSINIGYFTGSSGANGLCIGTQNFGTSTNSTAVGDFAQPHFPNNSALGNFAVSRGTYSVAVGCKAYTSFNSEYTTALGYFAQAFSSNLATKHSIAVGNDARASGDTIAIGRNTRPIRPKTVVIGHGTALTSLYANGDRTIMIGAQNTAKNYTSLSIGYNIYSSIQNTTFIGQNINVPFSFTQFPIIIGNQADEINGGNENIAIGYQAVSEASAFGSVVIGSSAYNKYSRGSISIGHNASVGSSTYISFYNTAIGTNANVWSASAGATASIAIGRNTDASGRVDSIALGTGVIASSNYGFFVRHNTSMVAGTPARFQTVNELVELVSSARFKENIVDLEEVDDKFDYLRPVRYKLKGKDENLIGLVAEELEELFPEFVTYENDENDENLKIARGIDYEVMVSILIKQTQYLNRKNKLISKTIETLQKNEIEHDNLLQNIQEEINKRMVQ